MERDPIEIVATDDTALMPQPTRCWLGMLLLAGKAARLIGWLATGAWPTGQITVDYSKAWPKKGERAVRKEG